MAEVRAAPEEGMQANGADTAPAAGMISQYVKDLSFENPNAPGIFQRPSGAQPQIDVQFNIGANQIGDEVHEVLLKLEVRAEADGEVARSEERRVGKEWVSTCRYRWSAYH